MSALEYYMGVALLIACLSILVYLFLLAVWETANALPVARPIDDSADRTQEEE